MTGISAYKKLNDMAARYLGSHYDEIDFIFTDERLLNDNRVKGYLDYKPADESSIYGKRDFPENFLYYSEKGDEVPLLITNEDMRSTNLLFAYFSNSIMTAPSGKETDLRTASLVAHLHPKKGRNFFSIRFF